MNVAFEDVLTNARTLPRSEKAELARLLIKELDGTDEADLEPIWREELKRRVEAVSNGEMETHDGDEVMARLRALVK